MKYLSLLIFILIAGCSQAEPELGELDTTSKDFGHYMGAVNPPEEYDVVQIYRDSGFAGVDAGSSTLSFSVYQGVISGTNGSDTIEARDMDKQKDTLWNYEFMKDEYIMYDGKICFLHEEFFKMQIIACFEQDKLVLVDKIQTKGNHQSIREMWRLENMDYPLHEEECKNKGVFCDIMTSAVQLDVDACETLNEKKESCENFKQNS